ncbi:MAG: ABC transporter permease, partial [Verrucomicrobia bacterium]
MHWPLYLALKQLFPTGRRFPFFTFISILGVALGVTLLIVSISVMGGFGREIRNMIVNTQGEVQVRAFGLMQDPQVVMKAVNAVEGVVASTPFAEGVVMLQHENKPAFPAIQGVDLDRVEQVVPLRKYIVAGSFDALDDDRVILSSQLAIQIGARLGSKVSVYSPLLLEKLKADEVLLPKELEVCGIFEIGHQQLDSSVVIVTLRTMQELYGLGRGVHGVNVKIADGADPDRIASRINRTLPVDGMAKSWMDANEDFLFILQLEKNMIFFLLLFIIVVAAFSVASSLLIAVVRKTREIGLLGALGATPKQVAACFCYQGVIIGAVGTLGGVVFGFVVVHFRNEMVAGFTRLTGSQQALERFYQFSQLPAYLSGKDLALIVCSSLLVSTLAG